VSSTRSRPEPADARRVGVVRVQESLVTLEPGDVPVRRNEVGHTGGAA